MIADPERALTLAYAPAHVRPALAALWRLDERLGEIVAATREPMIGRIRLAWWREALEGLDRGQPPAEPLLREIAETILPLGVTGTELAAIEEGWAVLLDGDPPGKEAVEAHGRLRGRPLFVIAARMLCRDALPHAADAGEGWALADLGERLSDPTASTLARARARARLAAIPDHRWPRALRPLGALAILARRDARGPGGRRQGSPGRVARLLFHGLTGR